MAPSIRVRVKGPSAQNTVQGERDCEAAERQRLLAEEAAEAAAKAAKEAEQADVDAAALEMEAARVLAKMAWDL